MDKKQNSNRRPPKGRGRPGKKNFSAKEEASSKVERSAHNDANWYTVNGQLLKDVASFSFNNQLGSPFTLRTDGRSNQFTKVIPGTMSILTVPTIGVSNDPEDPVNIAAKNIYSFVRHANSGHSNYDPADLMLYLMSMDSIYTYWAYLVRIYGVANIFSQTNRYVGDAYLRAMGVYPNEIRAYLADLRAYINMYAVKASSMCVPNTMSYFIRHSWMYSNIYKDEDVSKSQVYMYVPAFLHKYAIDSVTGAGKLEAVPIAVNVSDGPNKYVNTGLKQLTMQNLRAIGNDLINSMLKQEDVGIMSGDILKAYGEGNLWRISPLPENYGVLPVFSEEMLEQIHNTEFAGQFVGYMSGDITAPVFNRDYSALDVKQDTEVGGGILLFNPSFNNASQLGYDKIVDFWKEEVTPEMVMVATRNKLAGTFQLGDDNKTVITLTSCGSEIALFAVIGKFNANGELIQNTYYNQHSIVLNYDVLYFNAFPIRYNMNVTGENLVDIEGSIDNYTVIDPFNVEKLHTTALLSMFGVPYIK